MWRSPSAKLKEEGRPQVAVERAARLPMASDSFAFSGLRAAIWAPIRPLGQSANYATRGDGFPDRLGGAKPRSPPAPSATAEPDRASDRDSLPAGLRLGRKPTGIPVRVVRRSGRPGRPGTPAASADSSRLNSRSGSWKRSIRTDTQEPTDTNGAAGYCPAAGRSWVQRTNGSHRRERTQSRCRRSTDSEWRP